MPIPVKCRECDWTAQAPDRLRGATVKCKSCGSPVRVGGPARRKPEPEEAAPPPIPKSQRGKKKRKRSAAKSRSPAPLLIGGGALGGIALFMAIALAATRFVQSIVQANRNNPAGINLAEYDDPDALYPVESVAVPAFPELPSFQPVPENRRVTFAQFPLNSGENPGLPGGGMTLRVYRPEGSLEPRSAPCVLVAPAGTPLLHGNALDSLDYHAETLPYAEAGMFVIFYSLDGGVSENSRDPEFRAGYLAFREAQAGIVNARNALEFALARLPEVDPQRIYCAGHSSAATLTLLMAAHEPRLAGCLAYCAATNVEVRMGNILNDPKVLKLLPGLTSFVRRSSPDTHFSAVRVPVFLFHARDDGNTPFADAEQAAQSLRDAGKDVTFSVTDRGNHYESMVNEGIPRGIEWIKSRPARQQ